MAQYIDNQNPNSRSTSPVLAVVLVIALILIALLLLPRLFAGEADTMNINDTAIPGNTSDMNNEAGMERSQNMNGATIPVVNTTVNSTTTTTTGTTTR